MITCTVRLRLLEYCRQSGYGVSTRLQVCSTVSSHRVAMVMYGIAVLYSAVPISRGPYSYLRYCRDQSLTRPSTMPGMPSNAKRDL